MPLPPPFPEEHNPHNCSVTATNELKPEKKKYSSLSSSQRPVSLSSLNTGELGCGGKEQQDGAAEEAAQGPEEEEVDGRGNSTEAWERFCILLQEKVHKGEASTPPETVWKN